METKRRPIFMTDNQVNSLQKYFLENGVISYDSLIKDFKLVPKQIKSLVLSGYLKEEGNSVTKRYIPGFLWDTTGIMYRYGSSKQISSEMRKNISIIADRTKEDYERAFLFRIGDQVCYSYGNAPSGLGVVVDILPANRKVMVRWPFGTYQEHVDELNLIYRDNGDRQISLPTVDKDLMNKVPEHFDPALYNQGRSLTDSYSTLNRSMMSSASKKKILKTAANYLLPHDDEDQQSHLDSDYIISQAEIVVSVNTEKNNPLYKDTPWYITKDTEGNVNDNGDCWESGLIKKAYKSFIGAYNFYEHDQVIEKSKGRVLDSVLRRIPSGTKDSYYSVEILVATNKKHKKLASRIASGDLATLSMGCSCSFTRCSQCGNIATTPEGKCHHLKHNKGGFFIDQYGVRRIVAEICGSEDHPNSVEFEEASWVEIPAWKNAQVHNILAESTSRVNVVGYLNTRLYNKDSFEILLSDGKTKDVKIRVKKKAADDFGDFAGFNEENSDMGDDSVGEEEQPKDSIPTSFEFDDRLDEKGSSNNILGDDNLIRP